MKRLEQVAQLKRGSLIDLKKEISQIEQNIQKARLEIAFGKSKQVRLVRNHKRNLARALTIANQQLNAKQVEK